MTWYFFHAENSVSAASLTKKKVGSTSCCNPTLILHSKADRDKKMQVQPNKESQNNPTGPLCKHLTLDRSLTLKDHTQGERQEPLKGIGNVP